MAAAETHLGQSVWLAALSTAGACAVVLVELGMRWTADGTFDASIDSDTLCGCYWAEQSFALLQSICITYAIGGLAWARWLAALRPTPHAAHAADHRSATVLVSHQLNSQPSLMEEDSSIALSLGSSRSPRSQSHRYSSPERASTHEEISTAALALDDEVGGTV